MAPARAENLPNINRLKNGFFRIDYFLYTKQRVHMNNPKNPDLAIMNIEKNRKWIVNEITSDFNHLDTWEIPLKIQQGKPRDLETILKVMHSRQPICDVMDWATEFLYWLRKDLGKLFGWDRHINLLPIPGCAETSVSERLKKLGLTSSNDEPKYEMFEDKESANFKTVYSLPDESLLELSNNTVHGLLHYGLVRTGPEWMTLFFSVYAKPRGMLGHFYIVMIKPFRRFIVYPTTIRNAKKNGHVSVPFDFGWTPHPSFR